jgi:hypothetical protein
MSAASRGMTMRPSVCVGPSPPPEAGIGVLGGGSGIRESASQDSAWKCGMRGESSRCGNAHGNATPAFLLRVAGVGQPPVIAHLGRRSQRSRGPAELGRIPFRAPHRSFTRTWLSLLAAESGRAHPPDTWLIRPPVRISPHTCGLDFLVPPTEYDTRNR